MHINIVPSDTRPNELNRRLESHGRSAYLSYLKEKSFIRNKFVQLH